MPEKLTDQTIKHLLTQSRTIVIIGLSSDESKPSHKVACYLQAQGYTIIPIHPKGGEIQINGIGHRAFATLQECARDLNECGEKIDIIDVFRKSDALPQVADEILALGNLVAKNPENPQKPLAMQLPTCVWVQLGLTNAEAKTKLTQAGIHYIEDSCIKLEHERLLSQR